MRMDSEIAQIATAVEAVQGRTDAAATQVRLQAGGRLIEVSRGRLLESVTSLSQLSDKGTISGTTLEWIFDRFHEEGHRNEEDRVYLH
ncbi:hypothetical protein JXD20_01870 [Candidatus Peregrinibacteria bacterium]|nr:hypothetical protein [Candidatus Peregrinibacteria bacterium]